MDNHFKLTGDNGIFTSASAGDVLIGETPGCDVRLANDTPYDDVVVARISPAEGSARWVLVRLSKWHTILVNGHPVNRVVYLNDGDYISFGKGMNYRYRTVPGLSSVSKSEKRVNRTPYVIWTVVAAAAVLFGLMVWRDNTLRDGRLSERQLADAASSLVRLEVDSLALFAGDEKIDGYAYTSAPVGTGFISPDSLLLTARHCVEPWLNVVTPSEISELPSRGEHVIRMALECETTNQLAGYDSLQLVAYISATDAEGKRYSLKSSDFATNRSRDEIIELGDYYNDYYWRSISHRYGRYDMMLGDVAVAQFDRGGKIDIGYDLLTDGGVKVRDKLTFIGFPQSEAGAEAAEPEEDELRQPLSYIEGSDSIFAMLAHGGRLAAGYSGAPVLVRDGNRLSAIGIVSVLDSKNGHRSYSVPIGEALKAAAILKYGDE